MSLFNKTKNFSNFHTTLYLVEPIITLVLSNLPKYIFSFGIVGNVISLFIFSRPCLNRKTNSGKLYAFLCGISLILIVYNMAGRKLDKTFAFKLCLPFDTQVFINIILLQYWSWIQVLITFDRFVGVFYPVKGVRIMAKKWVLCSIIFGMLLFIIGVNSTYYVTSSTYMVGNETRSVYNMMSDEVKIFIEMIKILIHFIIPFFLLINLDVMVVVRLRKLKTGFVPRQSTSSSKSLRFSRNTILIDFIYLIFNFPPIIFNVLSIRTLIYKHIDFSDIFLYFNLIPMFNTIFPYIYPSILFIVFITFNRIFRSEFISVFCLDKCFILIKNSCTFS